MRADLRAAVEDGKLLFARDRASGLAARPGANRRNYT
jgi:hypothetical protein